VLQAADAIDGFMRDRVEEAAAKRLEDMGRNRELDDVDAAWIEFAGLAEQVLEALRALT
jgi:hypothetical protein